MLHKLHEAGYVHGDIKKENIIFNDDKDFSYLIDFDLAKKEGGKYPEGFRFFEGVSYRHPHAKKYCVMRKEHDRCSLQCVMKRCALCLHLSQSQSVKAIMDELDRVHVPLDKIASELCCLDF